VKYLTIRGIPEALARALTEEKARRGSSLNQTVIDLLLRALGVGTQRRSNGLGELAGTWTHEDLDRFEEAIASTEQLDEELWR
jgi:hypothetical protein